MIAPMLSYSLDHPYIPTKVFARLGVLSCGSEPFFSCSSPAGCATLRMGGDGFRAASTGISLHPFLTCGWWDVVCATSNARMYCGVFL